MYVDLSITATLFLSNGYIARLTVQQSTSGPRTFGPWLESIFAQIPCGLRAATANSTWSHATLLIGNCEGAILDRRTKT